MAASSAAIQAATHFYAHAVHGLVYEGLGHHLLQHILRSGLRVGRVGVLAHLVVKLLHAPLIFCKINLVAAYLGYRGAGAEDLAAVGECVTDDEGKKSHCYNNEQQN